eukprot:6182173-Pleurochrysis_carterae.AAC.1
MSETSRQSDADKLGLAVVQTRTVRAWEKMAFRKQIRGTLLLILSNMQAISSNMRPVSLKTRRESSDAWPPPATSDLAAAAKKRGADARNEGFSPNPLRPLKYAQ